MVAANGKCLVFATMVTLLSSTLAEGQPTLKRERSMRERLCQYQSIENIGSKANIQMVVIKLLQKHCRREEEPRVLPSDLNGKTPLRLGRESDDVEGVKIGLPSNFKGMTPLRFGRENDDVKAELPSNFKGMTPLRFGRESDDFSIDQYM